MTELEITEQNERVLMAALITTICNQVQDGADLDELLADLPGEIHSDVIEELARLDMI